MVEKFHPVLATIWEDPIGEAEEVDFEEKDTFDFKWMLENPLEKLTIRPVKGRKPTPTAFLTLSSSKSELDKNINNKDHSQFKPLSAEQKILLQSLSNTSGSLFESHGQLESSELQNDDDDDAVKEGSEQGNRRKWKQVLTGFFRKIKSKKGSSLAEASNSNRVSSPAPSSVISSIHSPREIFRSIFGGRKKKESFSGSSDNGTNKSDDAETDDFIRQELSQKDPKQQKKKKSAATGLSTPVSGPANPVPIKKPNIIVSKVPEKNNDFTDEQNLDFARWDRRNDFIAYISGKRPYAKDFASKYRVKQLLGDGAFGFVVIAENIKENNKNVAVKFMVKSQILNWVDVSEETGKKKSKKTYQMPVEIYLLKNLDHPNIIKYLDSFSDDKYFYLVTELHGTPWHPTNPKLDHKTTNLGLRRVANIKNQGNSLLTFIPRYDDPVADPNLEGIDLDSLIKSSESSPCDLFECIDAHHFFPVAVARSIFRQLVQAVLYLNQSGVVHRDLKEENIVIDENYVIKIIDFGAAWWIPEGEDRSVWFSNLNGTPEYAAPEVLQGHAYRGPEAEIWALGILLFTIVYRQSPFHNVEQVIRGDLQYPFTVTSSLQAYFKTKPLTVSTKNTAATAAAAASVVDDTLLTFDYETVLERKYGVDSLISGLLETDVGKRFTLQDILAHPWITEKFPKQSQVQSHEL